jgi:PA-IL-like protein
MSFRNLSLAAAFVLAVAVAVVLAQPQVTVVLTNGQSYNGSLVYRNNTVGVMTANGLRSFPATSVAVIEFAPGQPNPDELSQLNTGISGFLSRTQNVLVLQNGQVLTGSGVSISQDGNQVSINTTNGRNNYMASDIARLYLNPSAAQRLLASNQMNSQAPMGAVGTSGQFGQAQTISVVANQPWTATGMTVNQGDQVSFRATGQIQWGPAPGQTAGPNGGRGISGNYPVPTAGVGAVIGRVGNSQAFVIPANGETVTMPASGPLYLGINDDNVSDNNGTFQVQIARTSGY